MIDKADKLFFAKGIGKSILKKFHDYYVSKIIDDLDRVRNIKRIIEGITEYLKRKKTDATDIEKVVKSLKHFAGNLYLFECIRNKREDESLEEVQAESKMLFDFLFDNEKYPE